MKITKIPRNARLKVSLFLMLLITIIFVIYNFGAIIFGIEKLVESSHTTLLEPNKSMSEQPSISHFWDDSIDIQKAIPADVYSRTTDFLIAEKTISVDVSKLIIENMLWLTNVSPTERQNILSRIGSKCY